MMIALELENEEIHKLSSQCERQHVPMAPINAQEPG